MDNSELAASGCAPSWPSRIVRIAVGASALVAGLLILGAVFGSATASADEQPPEGSSLVGVVASTVSSTVSALPPVAESPAQPVAQPAPAAEPVGDTADTDAADLTDAALPAVTDAMAAEPAAAVLQTPIVDTTMTAGDDLLGQVPVVSTLVGDAPLNGILTPISATLDDSLGVVAGTVAPVVDALGTAIDGLPTRPAGNVPATSAADSGVGFAASAPGAIGAGGASPGDPPPTMYSAAVLWTVMGSSPRDGAGLPGPPNPSWPASPATSSTSGSSADGAPGAVARPSDEAWHPLAVVGGPVGTHDDTLPTAPTFESDESPD